MYIVSCLYFLSVNLLMKAIATCSHFTATFSVSPTKRQHMKKKKKKCFYLTHHTFHIIHIYPC